MKKLMKKEKGKMKSEKVWTSLLLPFSLLLFTSAADAAEDVSYWDSDAKEEKTQTACQAITTSTTTLEDGWYVVTAKVSVALIEVKGAAHLILADGSQLKAENGGIRIGEKASLNIYGQTAGTGELIARGSSYPAPDSAGIGSCLNGAGGSVTINGGIVRATGAHDCAGIGAGGMATFDTVTINGGQVVATGGGYAAGIGGGLRSSFWEVRINGGTVTAQHGSTDPSGTVRCAPDIGRGVEGVDGPVMINGGSVKASEIRNAPKNKAGELLYKVTAECEGIWELGLGIGVEGLDGYGTRDVYPVDGRVYLYLPNGTHSFSISGGEMTLNYYVVVNGRDVTVEPLPSGGSVGFFVNGRDVGGDYDPTAGWSYVNDVLTLTQKRDYVLSGAAMNNEVQIKVEAEDARVILSNAVVFTSGRAALEVEKSTSLLMAGDVSYLVATNNASAVSVAADTRLTVDLGPGGDRLESMIGVFGFDAANAIGGDGAVEVNGGTFVALADAPAVVARTFTCDADSVIMAVGDDPENARFASSAGASKYVLVAPFCRVRVPVEIPGIRSYVVADTTEPIAPSETVNATNVFKVMVLDDITIDFTADEGYEIVGGGCVTIPRITGDVTFGSEDLPVPDIRRKLTVTLPESVEGLASIAVWEGEIEVEGEVEGEGKKVYPVRSGYDVEIVCTAQDGWRIVSETNVVRFANIQESQVLTAADLPQAWRLFTVKVPEMENARCILTSTDDLRTVTSDGSELILSNSEVTVTFVEVGNYRITANGDKTWTLTGDVTFGTTEGFPLPMVEMLFVPVRPGELVVCDTAEEATNVAKNAVLTLRDDVSAAFGGNESAKAEYCAKFGFAVVPTSGGQWAVVAGLKPEAWSNVVESAQAATRQIPVADLAALELGVPTDVTVTNCVPGFYYTLRGSGSLEGLGGLEGLDVYGPELCGAGGEVTFSEVVKPSDAAGFFSIGARAAPVVTGANSDFVANHAVKMAGGLYLEGEAEDRIVEIRGIDTRIIGNTAGESSDAW